MLEQLTTWLKELVVAFLGAIWDLFTDWWIAIFELMADAFVWLMSQVPVPEFLSHGLAGMFVGLDPGIAWLLNASGLAAGLGIIGGGYVFRLGRKVFTLFQW